jgi:beta-glucanase (GH16 family)
MTGDHMKLILKNYYSRVLLFFIMFIPMGMNLNGQTYNLVWSDEFDYTGLPDTAKWNYNVGGHGWGNQELQYYTDRRLENARVEDGKLVIEARRETYAGKDYTSARLVTKNKGDWIYGKFVISAKLPKGRGTWPAIWMLPTDWEYGGWPSSGEIDIMEHVGYDEGTVHGTVHTEAYNHSLGTQQGNSIKISDGTSTFHEYSIVWTPVKIDFFADDTKYFTFYKHDNDYKKWPFNKCFHLIMNIAVGGTWGGVQGVDVYAFPVTMEVDYVRVYQTATAAGNEGNKKIGNADYSEKVFNISPNPFNDKIRIRYSVSIDQIDIYNCTGKKIMAAENKLPDNNTMIIPGLENLEPGIYFICLLYQNDLRGIRKAVKCN